MSREVRMSNLNPLLAKLLLIALLTIVLLLPLSRVESLIAERASLRDTGGERVANGAGHAPSIGAVMLSVPVTRTWTVDGKECSSTTYHHLLASEVEISGNVDAVLRKSGIYTVPAFHAALHISGSFSNELLIHAVEPEPDVGKKIGTAELFLAISDP